MQTPAHLIFGMAAFGKAGRPAVTTAAFIGGLLPDLSLYLLAAWHLNVRGVPPDIVFGELYFSNLWQSIFRIDNSLVLWGAAFAVAFWLKRSVFMALCGAALLHILCDLPLHHDDGRAHFWPITDWIYQSPVSYWDPAHYGHIVGPIEAMLVFIAAIFLWRRHINPRMRGFVALIAALELVPIIAFALMFN